VNYDKKKTARREKCEKEGKNLVSSKPVLKISTFFDVYEWAKGEEKEKIES